MHVLGCLHGLLNLLIEDLLDGGELDVITHGGKEGCLIEEEMID